MKYREDKDLEFLKGCDQEDLDVLVQVLTKDKDGSPRFTEELTSTECYKTHHPNHREYWELIAAEIQTFGANTFVTKIFRGDKGVLYNEVLRDVCKKLKVNFNKESSVAVIEMNLLMKVLADSIDKMSNDQVKEVAEALNLPIVNITKDAVILAIQSGIKLGGFFSYQIAVIVANHVAKFLIGRGLSFAANVALTRTLSIFAGPIGLAIMGIWTLVDIA